jgi:hypothetical protein
MHEWLVAITNSTVLVIDAMVLVIIAIGSIQAFVQGLRVMLLPSASGHERRNVWHLELTALSTANSDLGNAAGSRHIGGRST